MAAMACFRGPSLEIETLKVPNVIKELYKTVPKDGKVLTSEELLKHVNKGFEDPKVNEIIDMSKKKKEHKHFSRKISVRNPLGLFSNPFSKLTPGDRNVSLEEFLQLLLDPDNTPAVQNTLSQDMTAPLSHYFIYTGHNSYLEGNQLTSNSSVRPIIASLQRGVRVIELDLWPDDKKEAILVKHGGTLTKPVAFEDCILAIKENAFVVTEFPVIITLEDHLPSSLQAVAARVLQQVLGGLLWMPPADTSMEEFPSPENLKGRIIISTQPPKIKDSDGKPRPSVDGDAAPLSEISLSETKPEKEENGTELEVPHDSFQKNWGLDGSWGQSKVFSNSASLGDEDSSGDESTPFTLRKNSNGTVTAIIDSEDVQVYGRMITIAGGRMPGEPVKVSLMGGPSVKRVSVSEIKLATVAKDHPDDLVRFTQRNILRIYPKGTRVTSSNYNPLLAWSHGAQMVAINMQGYGKPLWLVHGFFAGNGGCGYIKKPAFFLEKKKKLENHSESEEEASLEYWNPRYPGPVKKVLQVKVLLGLGWLECFGKTHFDRFSPPDFYVQIGIAGVPADASLKTLETKTDQWHPSWEEQVLEFPLCVPELALLTIEVSEYDVTGPDAFGGQAVLPVGFLQEGIRCVPLCDRKGRTLKAHKDKSKKSKGPPPLEEANLKGPRLLFSFKFV